MSPRTLFKDCGDSHGRRFHEEVRETMLRITHEYLDEMELDSKFFQNNPPYSIPSLEPCEVQLDKRIGMGEFGVLLEVSNISLRKISSTPECDEDNDDDDRDAIEGILMHKPLTVSQKHSKSCGSLPAEIIRWEDITEENRVSTLAGLYSPEQQRLRQVLSGSIRREIIESNINAAHTSDSTFVKPSPSPRFAVKQLRKDLYPKKLIEAGKDLAREAKFLCRLDHPNIVGLRATVGNPGEYDFMLLLDRLGISLSEQMTDWHRQLSNGGGRGFPWKNSQRKAIERTVLSERLTALYDVSCAMQYLHQKLILFRDLKTENAARSHHGAFQILDFGLAKEIKEKDRVVASTDEESGARWNDFGVAYRLTGLTGTIRIMSPEVLQCHPYGLSADVYSFGIVIWEIFQGDRNRLAPVETIKGQRPALPVEGMPSRIESILKKVFADPAFRPTFAMLRQELEYQLLELRQEEWQAAVSASQEAPYLPQLLGARGLDIRPSNRIGELIALGSTP